MKMIYNLLLQDAEYEELQKQPMGNFEHNATDWYCPNGELAEFGGGDYYTIENPSEGLELLLTLKGYTYDVELDSKGWQKFVERNS